MDNFGGTDVNHADHVVLGVPMVADRGREGQQGAERGEWRETERERRRWRDRERQKQKQTSSKDKERVKRGIGC